MQVLKKGDKAMNLIFMRIGDHVLKKLDKWTYTAQVWELLDRLYMSKTLPNQVHAQPKNYSFRMQDTRTINQNVDDFSKLIADLDQFQKKYKLLFNNIIIW